jgi:hypothetical protein
MEGVLIIVDADLIFKRYKNKIIFPESWSNDIEQFGASDKTCVEFFYENNILKDIHIRLDLKGLSKKIVDSTLAFITKNNAFILTNDGMLIEPSISELMKQIKCSDAYSFVKNPEEFLKSLGTKPEIK